MGDLDDIFQRRKLGLVNPIELLVMSACQTATGDQRAVLGLAGFALQSGARSTIASLWSVDDQATADLMVEFYAQLNQGNRLIEGKDNQVITTAEALRQAQLAMLNHENTLYAQNPYFWAGFVLVGNWL